MLKLMTRMLLINWHYIKYQVIEFSNINFLTGKNGAGKSTIIDALQLVLLGDTSGYYFNKAANDKSQRSLKGYLRGEVAEDEDSNTVYLRNDDFSSYLVLEFHDQKINKYFCLGIVFDSYGDGSHDHQFFYLNDKLPDSHFIDQGTELNRKALKAFFLNNYARGQYEFFESNNRYQEVALGKLGQINKKFFRLLKKAVPFSPIMDIKGFISEFVCDVENKIDITDMQENIRYYKQLEHDLEIVKKKIEILKDIRTQYDSYNEELQRLKIQTYLVDRAMEEQLQEEINVSLESIKALKEKIAAARDQLDTKELELTSLNHKRDQLVERKIKSKEYSEKRELEDRIKALEKELEEIEQNKNSLTQIVKSIYYTWKEIDSWCQDNLKDMPSIEEELKNLLNIAGGSFNLITRESLSALKEIFQEYLNKINDYHAVKKRELDDLQQEIAKLSDEIKNLKHGIKAFPPAVVELKSLISQRLTAKYDKAIGPQIFADLLEIKSDRWRNAIEGYLNTQKFYLIIEPQYFVEALKIYDEFKLTHKIYDVGLVDIEKIMDRNPRSKVDSLAEEIETPNTYARAYANYLLGHVIKCDKVENLRNYKTAITPSCMLYHNYVARQINPARYETPYIGQRAIADQLRIKEERFKEVSKTSTGLEQLVHKLAQMRNTSNINDENIRSMLQGKDIIDRLPVVKKDWEEATRRLGSLDLSHLFKLEEELEKTEQNIAIVNKQIRQLENSQGKYSNEKEQKEKSIPNLEFNLRAKQDFIKNKYDASWIDGVGEPRFQQELKQGKDPANIINNFTTAVKGTQSRIDNKWNALLNKRAVYNRDHNGGFDINSPNNNAYNQELKSLEETLLVDYEEKIRDAKEKAQQQFKEDFISKLKKNIDDAQEQIDDLNKALKDVPFGRDKYRFKVIPSAQYRKYYDMITDDMLLEGLTLFSSAFQSKYQDIVEELFRQIIDVDEGLISADRREELNKNLDKFTDYRTYLDFDLVVTDDRGMESRLSRVMAKKSGGETQTPFYISVLASFVQLYRIKNKNQDNTVRIIVFDEAYSKMDHQRIKESINLIRKLDLQVILSAPTEKIGDIAPLVDRNLCVTRIKSETIIKAFDPKEIREMGA